VFILEKLLGELVEQWRRLRVEDSAALLRQLLAEIVFVSLCSRLVGQLRAAATSAAPEKKIKLVEWRARDLENAHCLSSFASAAREVPPTSARPASVGLWSWAVNSWPWLDKDDCRTNVSVQVRQAVANVPILELYKLRAAPLRAPFRERPLKNSQILAGLFRCEQSPRWPRGWQCSEFGDARHFEEYPQSSRSTLLMSRATGF